MSDHAMGDATSQVPPGGSEDPEPFSSAYFVFWGFTLLLAMIVALQYLAWDWEASTRNQSAGHSNSGAAAELRAAQEKRIPQIKTSMTKIVKEHSGR